eukprot:TRINITY_DN21820_c0_g1_i1.p1 TRINITY_DN21820_c0_g1~~TRINITY_DN21820_c0_g1_i1.p1  ORF type:complete len:600 (+),score=127.59 TRINITY_DN21820_c0_g1_i1:33-1832(+)
MDELEEYQRYQLDHFKSVVGCSEDLAKDFMEKFSWQLEAAINAFFSGDVAPSTKVELKEREEKEKTDFNKYHRKPPENLKEIKPKYYDEDEDYFTDVISFETITHAVIAPCGHSFDENTITEWLEAHSACPICRKEIAKSKLVANYNLNRALEHFKEIKSKQVHKKQKKAKRTDVQTRLDSLLPLPDESGGSNDQLITELTAIDPTKNDHNISAELQSPFTSSHEIRSASFINVLWVDDDPDNNTSRMRYLQELGMNVFPVRSTKEAQSILLNRWFRSKQTPALYDSGGEEGDVGAGLMKTHDHTAKWVSLATSKDKWASEATNSDGEEGDLFSGVARAGHKSPQTIKKKESEEHDGDQQANLLPRFMNDKDCIHRIITDMKRKEPSEEGGIRENRDAGLQLIEWVRSSSVDEIANIPIVVYSHSVKANKRADCIDRCLSLNAIVAKDMKHLIRSLNIGEFVRRPFCLLTSLVANDNVQLNKLVLQLLSWGLGVLREGSATRIAKILARQNNHGIEYLLTDKKDAALQNLVDVVDNVHKTERGRRGFKKVKLIVFDPYYPGAGAALQEKRRQTEKLLADEKVHAIVTNPHSLLVSLRLL